MFCFFTASNFAGPSASNKPAAYQLSKQPPSNKTPAHQDYQASAHNIVPRLPVMMCVEEDHLTPEIDLQTVPWGDLVNDFWEEDDFDEPPNKAPRVNKCRFNLNKTKSLNLLVFR